MEYMELNQKLDPRILDKLNLGIEVVKNAALLLKDMGDLQIENKNDDFQDLVTNFDVLIEKKIIFDILKKYPNDGWISEENSIAYNRNNNVWILDPIDGTTNFSVSNDNFAISLAYYENMKSLFGIVYDVINDELYIGVKGYGSYLNYKKISVVTNEELNQNIVYTSVKSLLQFNKKYDLDIEKFANKVLATRSLGSVALEVCKVANGKAGMAISGHIKIWDIAAAKVILEEAGGYIKYFSDDVYSMKNTFMVSGNCNRIVKRFLKLLNKS